MEGSRDLEKYVLAILETVFFSWNVLSEEKIDSDEMLLAI